MVQCRIAPTAIQKFFDSEGKVVENGSLYTYHSGTTINAPTYTTASGTSENSNPIVLDAHGEAPQIWLDPTIAYTFVLEDSTGTNVWTVNQVTTGAADSSPNVVEYGADATASTDSTPAFNAAISAASALASAEIIVPTGVYRITNSDIVTTDTDILWKGGAFLNSLNERPLLPGVQETSTNGGKIFVQNLTTATDDSTVAIARYTTHTGGEEGFVNSALLVNTQVNSNVAAYEWAITAQLFITSANQSQSVSMYGQARIQTTAASTAVWASTFEVLDESTIANPSSQRIGVEIDLTGNGGDNSGFRNGIEIFNKQYSTSPNDPCVVTSGINLIVDANSNTGGEFINGVVFSGPFSAACLNTRNAQTGAIALGMKQAQKIAYEPTDSWSTFFDGTSICFGTTETPTGTFQINGTGVTISPGALSNTSGASQLPLAIYGNPGGNSDYLEIEYVRKSTGPGWPTAAYSLARVVDGTTVSALSFPGDGSVLLNNGAGFGVTLDNPGGDWRPTADANSNLGTASFRWKTVYASTGTINTSDAKEKILRHFSDAERKVAARLRSLVKLYQWHDAITRKGIESARIHAGVTAQDVASAFQGEGLDPARYGVWCSDDLFEDVTTEYTQDTEIPVTEEVLVERQNIEVRDGKAVLTKTSVYETRNKTVTVPVFDPNGAPVMVSRPASAGGPHQMMYEYPVTEVQASTVRTTERRLVGKRLGVRYDELYAWIIAGSHD